MLTTLLDKLFSRPLTQDAFARMFIEQTRRAGYDGELNYQPAEFRLRHASGAYFNLHNAFNDYRSGDKAQKAAMLKGYIATLFESGQQSARRFDDVKPHLRPVIRNLAMFEEVRLEHLRSGAEDPYGVVLRPLGQDCAVLLAVDAPESTATLTKGPEQHWGVNLDQALAIATDNLRDTSREAFSEVAPGVCIGEWADGYDSSRVLLPDVLQRAPIKGRPVFMIPNRDVLLVTGDRDEEGIRLMIELSFKALEKGRVVSSQLLTYAGRDIFPFLPEDELAQRRLATLERFLLQGNYHNQKELMDRLNAETEQDLFVASYMLFEQSEGLGSTFSLCSWTKDVVSLLPRTDRVALVEPLPDGTANTKVVAWRDVEAELGEWLVLDEACYPPRYRTVGFPNAEVLGRLVEV